MAEKKLWLSNVRSFIILGSGGGFTTFNKINSANFSGEKSTEKLSGVLFFLRIHEKNVKLNFVLVVAPILESKALYY